MVNELIDSAEPPPLSKRTVSRTDKNSPLNPMMQHYLGIKKEHPNELVLQIRRMKHILSRRIQLGCSLYDRLMTHRSSQTVANT